MRFQHLDYFLLQLFRSLQSNINNWRFDNFNLRIYLCFFGICILFFCNCFSLYNLVSTISFSAISTFGFVCAFSAFGFFSFSIVSLFTIWYQQLAFRQFRSSGCFYVFGIWILFFCNRFSLYNLVSTISILAISIFGFVYAFSTFGFFYFTIVSLSTIWYQQLAFRRFQPSDLFMSFLVGKLSMLIAAAS